MSRRTARHLIAVIAFALSSVAHGLPFTEPSPDAFKRATKQMIALDKAMADGVTILEAGDLKEVGKYSRHFTSLVVLGKASFGSSVLDPLGHCSAAGVYAQSWWRAKVSVAGRGDFESAPDSLSGALEQFQVNRTECLKEAQPAASAKSVKNNKDSECLTVFGVDPQTK
ncbi:hypothetical protein GIW61_27005, partial [Pseudomonas gessardii]